LQKISGDFLVKFLKIYSSSANLTTIYRAVPSSHKEIRKNDYVTKSLKWAIDHAEHVSFMDQEDSFVLRAKVKPEEVIDAFNPGEYRYVGEDIDNQNLEEVKRIEFDPLTAFGY